MEGLPHGGGSTYSFSFFLPEEKEMHDATRTLGIFNTIV